MKEGQAFERFGATWTVDRIYTVDPTLAKQHNLVYRTRYHAHIVTAPAGYAGIREIDAGLEV